MLAEPWTRLLALYQQIPALQAEDDLRALMVAGHGANPGDKGRNFKEFAGQLEKTAGLRAAGQELSTLRAGTLPMVTVAKPGEIEALRERQRASVERMERERAAKTTT